MTVGLGVRSLPLLSATLLGAFFVCPSLARPVTADPAKLVSVPKMIVGCREQDDLSQAVKLAGDKEALQKFLLVKVAGRQCRIFEGGEGVFIMDTSSWRGMAQVRKRGDVDAFWMPKWVFEE